MNVNEIIGNNLKKYRSAYNMTLNELSERLHKSISTISKYEKGSIAMDIPTFLEISQIFQISPSILLSGAFTLSEDHSPTQKEAEGLYMYTYSGMEKEIIQSLIEQFPPDTPDLPWQAHVYNDIKDFNNPGNCNGFYTGTFLKDGFLGTYILHNRVSESEHVMISCVKNLVNPRQQLGLVSGLSNYTMLPVTFKTVISSVEVTDKKLLTDLLLFSKEDFKIIKQLQAITIQNLR